MSVESTVIDFEGADVDVDNFRRISGYEIAGNPKQKVAQMVDLFYSIDISPHMLKEFDSFEEVFIAIALLKFRLMVKKQKDYGPGNIGKGGLSGLVTRTVDKIERLKNLVGEPEKQLESIKNLLGELPDDATADELDAFALAVARIANPKNAVENETVEDTFMDVGNYGDIGFAYLFGAWGKPLREHL